VKENYHVIDCRGKGAERTLAAFCRANGQILLPLVELVEQARLALDTVVEQVSQQTIETILQLSAEQIAGPRTPGRSSGEIRWYGSQAGRVSLADRQLSVRKPRLRRREKGRGGEVGVPAYHALQKNPAPPRIRVESRAKLRRLQSGCSLDIKLATCPAFDTIFILLFACFCEVCSNMGICIWDKPLARQRY
jgi:hypothetical protein